MEGDLSNEIADAAGWSRPYSALTDQPARLTDRLQASLRLIVNKALAGGLSNDAERSFYPPTA